jgi:hypothetical protein
MMVPTVDGLVPACRNDGVEPNVAGKPLVTIACRRLAFVSSSNYPHG